MNEWQLYPGNRRIRKEKSYVVIVPELFQKLENSSMPIFCDVCENCFSRPEDKKSFEKFKCCSFCADTWAYSHKDEWENGWRPSRDQIKSVLEKRLLVNSDLKIV